MLTANEQKAVERLRWAERFGQRTKWLLLVLGLATMAAAAHIFWLDLGLLPKKGEPASFYSLEMFWPTFFIAAGFWVAGLYIVVRAIAYWRGNPVTVVLVALERELSAGPLGHKTPQTAPKTE